VRGRGGRSEIVTTREKEGLFQGDEGKGNITTRMRKGKYVYGPWVLTESAWLKGKNTGPAQKIKISYISSRAHVSFGKKKTWKE